MTLTGLRNLDPDDKPLAEVDKLLRMRMRTADPIVIVTNGCFRKICFLLRRSFVDMFVAIFEQYTCTSFSALAIYVL